jgi:16S rRNA (guanine527-N7)-methyltransferase
MNDEVSREPTDTVGRPAPVATPSAPSVARRVFRSERLPLAQRYADLLATDGVVRGLIGPREAPRLWERHLLNCAVLGDLVPEGATVCDIGSGAGLPGLVLAIARPDLRITLVEPLLRRTTFLDEVVATLSLEHVEVVRGRAEALHGERRFDVVTSRAVAPLERLLGWSMPLVAPGGALVAMKGSSVHEEIAAAAPTLRRLGCAEPSVTVLGADLLESTTVALRVAWADPARVSWPLAAAPASRPRPRARRKRAR